MIGKMANERKQFFRELLNTEKPEMWLDMLDWILSDEKFYKWSPAEVKQYTTYINKMPTIDKNNFIYGNGKKVNVKIPLSTKKDFYIAFQSKQSVSRDLIRHIRNGIAHSNITFKKNRKYVEIIDYYTQNSKNSKKGERSAYLMIPCDFIFELLNIYKEIDTKL